MAKCKKCGVPLEGILGFVPKLLFGVKPSLGDPETCNKCSGQQEANITKKGTSGSDMYQCQVCSRMIHVDHAIDHINAEEYLIKLIKKDHPKWKDKEITCRECVDYYRKLVNDSEI